MSPGLATVCLRLGVELRIDLGQEIVGGGRRLHVGAMIDEMPDRDALGELGHAAEMIAVPMGDDQMVDLGEAGVLGGRHDAPGIADRRLGRDIAGVDEQRFAGRRDEERGVAALDVDHVDVQRGAGLGGGAMGPEPAEHDRESGDHRER